jgi:hypothetical protein
MTLALTCQIIPLLDITLLARLSPRIPPSGGIQGDIDYERLRLVRISGRGQ